MKGLKIIPLGGLGEIGMNCMILEYGDEIIVIDCGLLFSDLDHFGVGVIIPDFSYLLKRKDRLKAWVVTHGHEDHIGALPFAWRAGLVAPIYASTFSSLLIREKFKEHGLESTLDLKVFQMGDWLRWKHFQIQTVSVNHSIVDSAALFIHTPLGQVIHTGDFKIDPTPFYGSQMDLDVFRAEGDRGVLLLCSDSTNVERRDHSMSEKVIYEKFEQLFVSAQGLTVVSMFASNVGRMGQVLDLAKKLDKKVILAGRTMEQNIRLGGLAGYLKGAEDRLVPIEHLNRFKREQLIVLSTGSQAENRSALVRMAMGEHSQIQLQPGDLVLMSSKLIPGNEKAIGQMINQLFQQGAEVLYESVHDIHVSGHATRSELKEMLLAVRPRFFIPIHGEYRHLVHHAALAEEIGMSPEQVLIAVNGDIIELTPESCQVVEQRQETRVLIEDGPRGSALEISPFILKERRQLAEKGVVFVLLVRKPQTGHFILGPEIICRGLIEPAREAVLLKEMKKIVRKLIHADLAQEVQRFQRSHKKVQYQGDQKQDLQELIRMRLRRFLKIQLDKKVMVCPVILDLE